MRATRRLPATFPRQAHRTITSGKANEGRASLIIMFVRLPKESQSRSAPLVTQGPPDRPNRLGDDGAGGGGKSRACSRASAHRCWLRLGGAAPPIRLSARRCFRSRTALSV